MLDCTVKMKKDVSASNATLMFRLEKRIRYGALWRKSIKGRFLKGKRKTVEA